MLISYWIDRLVELVRYKAPEPRLWWNNNGKLIEVTCPPELDRIMVVVGLADSRSDAQRQIKRKAVRIKYGTEWQTIQDYRQTLQPGLLIAIHAESRNYNKFRWREIMIPESVNLWRPWKEIIEA